MSAARLDVARLDVVGVGNAIVDVIAHAEDSFLADEGLTKGAMALIGAERAEALYARMGAGVETSGGSGANTVAVLAAMGGNAAFTGKVADDQLGAVFRHDIRAAGVRFDTPALEGGAPTARCLILVTPDAQRTMNTFLGASAALGPDDIDAALLAEARVVYLEGYLFDPPPAQEAFKKAARTAKDAGAATALTLSDPFCVERHRGAFRELTAGHVDILFANEDEILSLYQADDFDAALAAARADCDVCALTRGEKGAVIAHGGEVHVIEAAPIEKLVDTTGAGDCFAAGFLYGHTRGLGLDVCGRLGCAAAARTIQQIGPRPAENLSGLVQSVTGAAA
ncbi:MAG: adenosine kinase [Rhodospirillales bacterium]